MTTDPIVKQLRQNATDAEQKLWHLLRRKQIGDLRFRRQYRLGDYIVDFVCLPARLIIEVDGRTACAANRTRRRENYLAGK